MKMREVSTKCAKNYRKQDSISVPGTSPLEDFRYHLNLVFTNHFRTTEYDTKSIFKRNLTGLNSEFSFSQTGCHTNFKELSLPYWVTSVEIGFFKEELLQKKHPMKCF